jgi:NTE family protein
VLLLQLAGCSTAQPWLNPPLEPGEQVRYDGRQQIGDRARASDLLVVASFSGGGSRAAALAHAALDELDAHTFVWDGRETTLAREVDMVAGVSGGSVAAAHFALHGLERHLQRFPADFLDVDFQRELVLTALRPSSFYRMSSPWLGRGQIMAQALDERLFKGATFGDLAGMPGRPYLIVGATNLLNGSEFDFASDQFGMLCSSIDRVPLSFAVASSSSVPLVFSPMTLQNHAERCAASTAATRTDESSAPGGDARVRLVRSESDSLTRSDRKYLHLVDGAVSDNLGLRRIADYVAQAGGVRAVLTALNDSSTGDEAIPRRIVFLSVNAETPTSTLGISARTPSSLDVLGALVNGNLGRHSRETSLVFDDAIEQWRTELRVDGADVDIFSIELNLAELRDDELRNQVLAIPTAFRISSTDQLLLRSAARRALADSDEFRRLLQSLRQASSGEQTQSEVTRYAAQPTERGPSMPASRSRSTIAVAASSGDARAVSR